MNKKGFTLTELLAVIVVLAILIGFAAQYAIGLINKSRNATAEDDKKTVEEVAKTYVENKAFNDPTFDAEFESSKEVTFDIQVLRDENLLDGNKKCKGTVTVKIVDLAGDKEDYEATFNGTCK